MRFFVVVEGGIGNQLFQAAFAEYVMARFPGANPVFLSAASAHSVSRSCELSSLGYDVVHLPRWIGYATRLIRWVMLKIPQMVSRLFGAVDRGGWSENCIATLPLIVFGYWQYPEIAEAVLQRLRQRVDAYKLRERIPCRASEAERLAVHVRCGDYLRNPEVASRYRVCTDSFYTKAVATAKRLMNGAGHVNVVIFTDDEGWVAENLAERLGASVVKAAGVSPLRELVELSLYSNFVISNSTFSWWAANISVASPKVVVAPDKWFVGVSSREVGIIPRGWVEESCD